MKITKACVQILDQLAVLIDRIEERDFCKPSEALSHSTIGQHLRHTLEFFICFEKGYHEGSINYDKRAHDKLIESDKFIALNQIGRIISFVQNISINKSLKLEVSYEPLAEEMVTIDTNATRELVYNIEHAVHHMAIMKIGIREVAPYIVLPKDFGVAASTIRHQHITERAHQ